MQTFGGASRQLQQKSCFYYGGPQQQRRMVENEKIPSFVTLVKNRPLFERRFFLNSSNSKSVTMAIVPATKILNDEAPGFYLEVYLTGEKCVPLALGGKKGLVTLLSTIREIPEFSKIPQVVSSIEPGTNIVISTVEWGKDVCIIYCHFILNLDFDFDFNYF